VSHGPGSPRLFREFESFSVFASRDGWVYCKAALSGGPIRFSSLSLALNTPSRCGISNRPARFLSWTTRSLPLAENSSQEPKSDSCSARDEFLRRFFLLHVCRRVGLSDVRHFRFPRHSPRGALVFTLVSTCRPPIHPPDARIRASTHSDTQASRLRSDRSAPVRLAYGVIRADLTAVQIKLVPPPDVQFS